MNPIEHLIYSTVRIECQSIDETSSGTGYFFHFCEEGNKSIPCIVTNKHVISNSTIGSFHITIADKDGKPMLEKYETIRLNNFENLWIKHPKEDVDLAILPIAEILTNLTNMNKIPYFQGLTKQMFPTKELLNEISSLEDIVMIGYPNGLWDYKHNLPIIRRGTTATHAKLNYNGKNEFLIDAACFPGSSGSPVFLANLGSFMNKEGNLMAGYRIAFLGTLYAGPQHTAQGDIIFSTIPKTITQIPNNLGLVIKYNALNDFEEILRKQLVVG